MFWHRSAILRESFRTEEYKSNTQSRYLLIAITGILKILTFLYTLIADPGGRAI